LHRGLARGKLGRIHEEDGLTRATSKILSATALPFLLVSFAAHAQKAGPFDGKWIGESTRCFPASNTYRFTNLTVANSSFTWTSTDAGRKATCTFRVDKDGTFTGGNCPFSLTGKLEGDKGLIKRQSAELSCEIRVKRE
jgi:hypothetical protein